MNRPKPSQLHIQMGQETLFLLLALSWFVAIVCMIYAAMKTLELEHSSSALVRANYSLAQLGAEPIFPSGLDAPLNSQPPIITLTEDEGFLFESGSATIPPEVKARLEREIVPRLLSIGERYDAWLIEVVGHTDEAPFKSSGSNLDLFLLDYLNNAQVNLVPADNTGLGMARAASVTRLLASQPGFERFDLIPLSAGQTQQLDGSIPNQSTLGSKAERRRIEIRVRRAPVP